METVLLATLGTCKRPLIILLQCNPATLFGFATVFILVLLLRGWWAPVPRPSWLNNIRANVQLWITQVTYINALSWSKVRLLGFGGLRLLVPILGVYPVRVALGQLIFPMAAALRRRIKVKVTNLLILFFTIPRLVCRFGRGPITSKPMVVWFITMVGEGPTGCMGTDFTRRTPTQAAR